MSGHTPGPWEATGASVQTHHGATDRLIAVTDTHDVGGDEAKANALIMAASLDLLAACRCLLDFLTALRPVGLPKVKADEIARLIAKAEGRS